SPPARRRQGIGRAAHHPDPRSRLQCRRARHRCSPGRGALHPATDPGGSSPVRTFAYARPTSVAEAAELLAEDGARPLGGGTDLLPQLERGIHPAATVVDLRGLGLDTIEEDGAGLAIGAAGRVAEL